MERVSTEDEFVCEVCNLKPIKWADDDGMLRCNDCHTVIATQWGADYGNNKIT